MHEKQSELSRLYHAALQKYLKQGSGPDMETARALGRHAMASGLETLDMARIHEIALVSLVLPNYSASKGNELMGRAGIFFAEAITPIEQTHRGAREAVTHLNQIVKELSQRTLELAVSVEALKQEISHRKVVEESLRASEQTSSELLEKSWHMQEELRQLSRQLLTVQEEERMKISRELHDVIAQTLTGINVQLGALKAESVASSKQLQQKIAGTQRLVEKSVDIVHRFASDLRPTMLDDLGLIPALKSFLKGFLAATGVRVRLQVSSGIEQSNSSIRTALYRVAQEALTNVARHAKASHAEVSIHCLDGAIRMEITDNGTGFEVDGMSSAKKRNRLGLLGMRERVEMVGGTFCVKSAPGKATTIRVEIPAEKDFAENVPPQPSDSTTNLECP
ncbi:MAG: sensor histidine kinase [Verrucomicrobiae bacterium]